MLGIHDLWLFVVSGLLLNMTPGPDTLYIVGRGATGGRRAGMMAALGIFAGCGVHILAAAFGLSALLAASATAFLAVKLVGAAYLVWMGVNALLSRKAGADPVRPPPAPARLRTVFAQGFLTNVLNPKVALFFLAFLPQFIDPAAPSKTLAFLFLGIVFNVNGLAWNLFIGWSAASVSARFKGGRSRLGAWLQRALGGLFIYLGIKLALSQRG